jgi:hypothetical protein
MGSLKTGEMNVSESYSAYKAVGACTGQSGNFRDGNKYSCFKE